MKNIHLTLLMAFCYDPRTLLPSVLNTSVEIILLSYKSDCYAFTQTLTEASHLRIKASPYSCLQSPTQSHAPLLLSNRFLLAHGLTSSHTGRPLLPSSHLTGVLPIEAIPSA